MAEKRKFNEEDMDGKIVRIKLKDFLTYDDCEFKPGEKLNVILGPNGTGKSSIVCAICLGLGGRTNLLGRAKLLSDYVKHRKKEATIEIELFKKNKSNLIVRRTFNTQSTNSKFEINGRVVTESAVINTVKKMNIQMDNLCQFLPQDRVIEFAKMNARELLVATEKAVGPDGMHADHVKLIDLRKKSGELESMIDGRKTYKEQIETSNQRLERDVKRYKEREKHQEKIQILKKKRPWVLYEEARKETIAAKDAKKVVEKKIKDMRKKHSPLKEKIDKAKVALKKAEDEIKVLSAEMNKTGQDMKKIDDKLEKQNDRIAEARQDFTSVQQDEQERHKKISQLEKQIESLQREYEEAPDPEATKPRITEIHNEVKAIQHQLNELNRQKTEILSDNTNLKLQITALKRRLAEVDNVDHQKLETLRRVDSDTYNAVLWLRQNKQMFSGTVYEPIMTQINMHDMKNAFYLENAISFRDMKAFVCQNREDQKLLSNQTRERLNLQISAVCPPRDAKDQYPPQQRIDNYKRFGFHSYITDLFQCPKTVYQYLCEAFHLHNIPIGVEAIDKNPENVINNTSLFRFYTPSNSYSINKSRYADKKSTSVNTVRKDANLLNPSVDLEVKKQLDTELSQHEHQMKVNNGKLEEISRKENALQKEQEKLRTEKKSLMTQMKKRTTLSNQIETRVKRLDEEKKTKIDIEKEERKFRDKVKKINATRIALVKEYQTVVQRSLEHGKEHIRLNIRRLQVKREVEVAEKNFRIVDSDLNNFIEQFENLSRGHNEAKNRAKKLLDEAKRLTGSTPDSLVPDALNRVFETLPDTIEEIEELICEEEASLNCQFETNPEVIKNYEKNKREISKLETELQDKDGELTEIKNTIEELLQSWLVPLEELINRINERYSDFFRRMGCAGEVLLKRDPNDDYSQYGIQINVKFRAENKMKELTSYFQSGGERSVSTMLYLISLQELTKCPFRLVDEINQGMDPKNERRVFELVVETVCRPNTSQYFLITPKLLPDLHYTEQMTILTVLNGYYMVPHNKFRLHDLIERKRKLNAQGA